jgi:hypothetical protein
MSEVLSLPDNPKGALAAFLVELEQSYYAWYENSVKWLRRIWHPLYWSGILIGASTAVIAALATEESFKSFGVIRLLLVILPIVGAFLSTVVVQSQLSERFQPRENGRRRVQHLLNTGRQRFAAAQKPEDYSAIHADLVKQLDAVEDEQGSGFFSCVHPARGKDSGTT